MAGALGDESMESTSRVQHSRVHRSHRGLLGMGLSGSLRLALLDEFGVENDAFTHVVETTKEKLLQKRSSI